MSGIQNSCQYKRVLYLKLRDNNNPLLKKYYKDYCQILSKVIKGAKRMEYDRLILNSNNVMRTSWKLINKELGKDCKKCEFQSLNINGRNISNLQDIANAFTNHFTTIPAMISQKVNASICSTKTSGNNQNNFSFSSNHVFQNTSPNIRHHCTTTNEIENIIQSLKSSNSNGYDEIPSRVLKLCSYFISSRLNYICSRTLLTGVKMI